MVALKSLLVACALGIQALAASNPVVCSTELGTKSVKSVPTSTKTTVVKVTVTKRIVRKVAVVVIPRPQTTVLRTTSTVISNTVADAATKTATNTITSKMTSTVTVTETIRTTTDTTTQVTKEITTTVGGSAGFTAVLREPNYVAKRDIVERGADEPALKGLVVGSYPQRVMCEKKIMSTSVTTVTTTVQGARVTRKAATTTKMSTVTTTQMSTIYPDDVSTTVDTTIYPTVTELRYSTTFSTQTNTVTEEIQVPVATSYAICGSDNMLTKANRGGYFAGFLQTYGGYGATTGGSGMTPEQCCAACAQNPYCSLSRVANNNGLCILFIYSTPASCANGAQPLIGRYLTNKNLASSQFTWSNGPCGQITNAGDINDQGSI